MDEQVSRHIQVNNPSKGWRKDYQKMAMAVVQMETS
jgi:hypothetical protein